MRKSSPGDGGVNLSVIITPFLDMSFQLLAFFIMTYHPSSLEGNIQGALAPKAAGGGQVQPDVEPAIGDLVLEQTTVIIVQAVKPGQIEGVRHDGEPSRILIKRMEDAVPVSVADADTPLEEGLSRLARDLKSAAKAGGAGRIHIESDGELKHVHLMRVYDVCRGAGYHDVAFVAPALARR